MPQPQVSGRHSKCTVKSVHSLDATCVHICYCFGLLTASRVKRLYQQDPNPTAPHPRRAAVALPCSFRSSTPGLSVFQKHQAYFQPVFLQGTLFTTNFHWVIFPNPPSYFLRDALPDCPSTLDAPPKNAVLSFLEFITMATTWLVPGRLRGSSYRNLAGFLVVLSAVPGTEVCSVWLAAECRTSDK